MYSMVCTRPNLDYAISTLSRFMSKSGKEHWKAMKWLMRYISGTTGYGLLYKKHGDQVGIEGYVDSDYAGDRDSIKSTTTYFFKVCGNCISWKSQL